jgi:hypothetical protein
VHRKKIWLIVIALVISAAAFVRVSVRVGYKEEEASATRQAIEQFHMRLSTGQYDEIYNDADEILQRSQSRVALVNAIQETANRYGKFKHVDFAKVNVIIAAPIEIRAVYNSTFERDKATELFTFVDRNGVMKIVHFQISPGEVRPSESR